MSAPQRRPRAYAISDCSSVDVHKPWISTPTQKGLRRQGEGQPRATMRGRAERPRCAHPTRRRVAQQHGTQSPGAGVIAMRQSISVLLRSLLRQAGSNIAQETKLAAEYHDKSGVPQIACVYCRHLGNLIQDTPATLEAGWSCKLVEGIVDTGARCRHWQGSPWPAGVSKTAIHRFR